MRVHRYTPATTRRSAVRGRRPGGSRRRRRSRPARCGECAAGPPHTARQPPTTQRIDDRRRNGRYVLLRHGQAIPDPNHATSRSCQDGVDARPARCRPSAAPTRAAGTAHQGERARVVRGSCPRTSLRSPRSPRATPQASPTPPASTSPQCNPSASTSNAASAPTHRPTRHPQTRQHTWQSPSRWGRRLCLGERWLSAACDTATGNRLVPASGTACETPSRATEGWGRTSIVVVAYWGCPECGAKIAQPVRRLGTHGTGGESPAKAVLQPKRVGAPQRRSEQHQPTTRRPRL